jgi:flagellar hook assembly protein FlgD
VDVQGPADDVLPSRLEFAPLSPNPTRSGARVWFSVPAALSGAPFEVAVYDLSGRRVQTIERGTARSGQHSVQWDLRDARGGVVDAGVYFVNVHLGNQSLSRKLIVMR